jgi:tetratricopeptide (TPR) repeat protein
MRKSLLFVLAAASAATCFGAIKGTITKTDGVTQKGEIRWSSRDKAYVITAGRIETQVPATDVEEMNIEKPAGFDKAADSVDKGQGASAIHVLEKIVKEYQRLQWDKEAGGYLARAYLDAGKADQALKACQTIISSDSTAAYNGKLAPAYWEALFQLGQMSKLEAALKRAAASGDRASSGAALIKRGDIVYKEGKETKDAARKALVDGYLRAVLMYTEPGVAEQVRPEALYKAARCFEKLDQASRADQYRTELRNTYKTSPWASK